MEAMSKNILDEAPLSIQHFLDFGISISGRLYDIHQKDLTHRDIRPENVSWDSKTKVCKLTEPVTFKTQQSLLDRARLPYISPEHTGRINRQVDYRTDFYSLGAVFYELLTGNPPFVSGDPLEIIHSHIAKNPRPLSELNSEVPTQISKIVMRLLKKNAEDRYQSASGLKHDLERCDAQLAGTGKIEEFKLRESDLVGVFTIPQKLYGRDNEIKILLNAFDRISKQDKELLLVAGYSGVGKSALVREAQKTIAAKRGYFIEGKFDQYQNNIPYFAWGQAFGNLMNQFLVESESRLGAWKALILESVSPNGKVLTDVIPNLDMVIGPQPEVPVLGGQEMLNRFNYVFRNFIRVVAQREHPLVVFLDDLQWIDAASLSLLKVLLNDPDLFYFLVIGAYRDNEVDTAHQLTVGIEDLRQKKVNIERISLQNLTEADVNALNADTLHCNPEESGPLSRVVYSKTEGNAFFLHQLLNTLYAENILGFDLRSGQWQWDITALQAMDISDNVADLMTGILHRLPSSTQELLRFAACIGNLVELPVLAIITGNSLNTVKSDLQAALRKGIAFSINNHYKFAHDRLQKAAYTQIPKSDRKSVHLKIGRLLQQHFSDQEQQERIFDIVSQFNIGAELLSEPTEQIQLAGLNLMAGRKARQAAAYESAFRYFSVGIGLLGDNAWEDQYSLTLDLHTEAVQTAYLSGKYAKMEELAETVLTNAATIGDKISVIETKIYYETLQMRYDTAVDIGLHYLRELGLDLTRDPSREEVHSALADLLHVMRSQTVEQLISLPDLDDPTLRYREHILNCLASPNYFGNWELMVLCVCKTIETLVHHGNSPESPVSYSFASIVLSNPVIAEYEIGYLAGQVALGLLDRQPNTVLMGNVQMHTHAFSFQYRKPLRHNAQKLLSVFQSALKLGNFAYTGFSSAEYCMTLFCSGAKLGYVHQEVKKYKLWAKQNALLPPLFFILPVDTMARYLRDPEKTSYNAEQYASVKQEALEGLNSPGDNLHLFVDFQARQSLAFHFDSYSEAVDYGEQSHNRAIRLGGSLPTPRLYFYDALACLKLSDCADGARRGTLARRIKRDMELLSKWAALAPMNFEHMLHLARAEQARFGECSESAASFYELAINTAKENGFNQDCALGYELAAEYYKQNGFDDFYRLYMAKAHQAYKEWGALALVKRLEKKLPHLLSIKEVSPVEEPHRIQLDLSTVIKASQAIAGEIVLERLLSQMIHIIIENAGAQMGFLILEKEKQWVIEAEGNIDKDRVRILQSTRIEPHETISTGVVQYVVRTQDIVVLDDAANKGDFMDDPKILQRRSKSILCTPLINQGKVSGIVYLENNLATGAFTPERVELLRVLSSQLALALDNAQLYADMEGRILARTAELEQEIKIRKQAEEAAEFASKTKSMFLANMSHELRTPLNAILGFSRMMVREPDTTADQQEKLGIINLSGEHLLAMINDVLDLSKIEAGRVELATEAFDLGMRLEDISKIFELRAKNVGLDFELIIDAELVRYVRTDSGKLRQILTNLLSNAVKFTAQGTISLRARSEPISGDPSMVKLQLEVEDSGCGISPELMGHIFEPFYQVSKSHTSFKGTGLGLAISKSFVEMMDGKISVDSTPGKGSLFRVELPLSLAEAAEVVDAGSPERNVLGPAPGQPVWRILVVEDNLENRLLLRTLLHKAGFEVREAENGAEAIDLFQQWQPHLIWMDMRMPVMDGYKATAKIRSLPDGHRVKIVAITASAFREQRQGILAAGCDEVVHKPFKDNEIFETMARLLDIKYLYKDMGAEAPHEQSINLTAEMLTELPGELLLELREATLTLDQGAIFAIIERVEPLAPDTARGLQACMDNLQLGLISDLLGENHEK